MHGPLLLLREKWLSESPRVEHNVLDCVSVLCEHLHHVCQLVCKNLAQAQTKLKCRHDKKSVLRTFRQSDKVPVLLPLPGSRLQSPFSVTYMVERELISKWAMMQQEVSYLVGHGLAVPGTTAWCSPL